MDANRWVVVLTGPSEIWACELKSFHDKVCMSNEENTDCVLYNSLFSQLEGLSFKPLYSSTKRNAFLTGVTVDGDKEVVCVCVCVCLKTLPEFILIRNCVAWMLLFKFTGLWNSNLQPNTPLSIAIFKYKRHTGWRNGITRKKAESSSCLVILSVYEWHHTPKGNRGSGVNSGSHHHKQLSET